LLARQTLDDTALLDKLNEGANLSYIFKVRGHHRVKGLFDQPLDIAESLDNERRLTVVDMHDDRERERRLEGVLGDK
jgi:hypothetical protein